MPPTGLTSGGPKGGHLKGGHLKMGFCSEVRTWKWDFALQFALDTSILTALFKGIPQGRRHLDREGAVWTKKAPSRPHRALKNAILRCPGLRCMGLGLPHNINKKLGGKFGEISRNYLDLWHFPLLSAWFENFILNRNSNPGPCFSAARDGPDWKQKHSRSKISWVGLFLLTFMS